jgi:FkbM family methyltransferase
MSHSEALFVKENGLYNFIRFNDSMILSAIKRRAVKLFTTVYDPLISLKIGNQNIKINLSHQLPEILEKYPEYNFNLARIVKYTEDALGNISVIDIGANVGDTVAFIRNYSSAPILCIDGEENYVNILRKNVAKDKNVNVCQALVGLENKEDNLKLKVEKGTAHIEKSKTPVRVRTLENILEEFKEFKESKIIKSDTDGFDTWILRSCETYLKTIKPILFFEFDPHFIYSNNDDPFSFIDYLKETGYQYFIFYTNVGDYLFGCSIEERDIIDQLIHYYSGRHVEIFLDICAFQKEDEDLFRSTMEKEIKHYQKVRNY